ncbi:MAG: DUF975 family protein [Kiritimatiellales bacterium]
MKSTVPLRDLTAAARAGLSGYWGRTVGVMFVCLVLQVGVSLIPVAGPLVQIIFSAPLAVGMITYLLATVRRQYNPFKLLFAGFSCFSTSLCTYLLVLLIMFLWTLPFVALLALAIVLVHPEPAFFHPLTLLAVGAILFFSVLFFMILIQMRYGLALFVVADDPSVSARQAIRHGVELMKGNYWRMGLLWLRFIGWQILCVLTLGIGLIWLVPYFMVATTAFYDDLARNG